VTATPAVSLRKDTRSRPPFSRVLVANRGEIALRIIRACHELGMEAVAVYSDADRDAGHVRAADRAVRIGSPPPAESYLRIDALVDAARATGSEAVHPGYGFLAERAAFARAVLAAGLRFVGPGPEAIEALGDKLRARRLARTVGVPVVPGTLDPAPVEDRHRLAALVERAREIGFPVLVKAAAGGGGRGMRRVDDPSGLEDALLAGSAEARSAFGDGAVYLEHEILPARHVEVQLLGDDHGTVIALGERDCSLQRRHQKLVEEAPAPGLAPGERVELHELAVRLARAAGLRNAATCEFLLDPEGRPWFLEVNTRLQVEHGVTELVSGVDIVREQFRIAAGEPLAPAVIHAAERAADPGSHAIEVRLSAEDPAEGFAPAPGSVGVWRMPSGPGIRVDTSIEPGDRVPAEYDNLMAKVLVHAVDRDAAVDRLQRALGEVEVTGVQTTLPFHRFVAASEAFRAAELSTRWVDEHWDPETIRMLRGPAADVAAVGVALAGPGPRVAGTRPIPAPRTTPASTGDSSWRLAGRRAALERWRR